MIRNPFRNLDHKKLSRSSEALKTQNDYHKIVNKRIVIFGIIIALIFSMVAVRLAFLQIREQDSYTAKLESYSSKKQTDLTPRGIIYDRNGTTVADTVSALNITYYPVKGTTAAEKWELAQKFSKQFDTSYDSFTLSDYQDAYIYLHKDAQGKADQANHLLSEEEKTLKVGDQEKLKRGRITKDMVVEEFSEADLKAYAAYQAMNKAPSSQVKIVMADVDKEKVYYLEEHKDDFPGFDVDMGGWKREYPYGSTLRDVLGGVSSSTQGVPSELRNYYEAKGYSMVDRVGTSGLEMQYENLLAGTRKVSEIKYDANGVAVLNEISSGKKGYNLHLSIDIELQKELDELLKTTLQNASSVSQRSKFNNLFVILMDPDTGEIYAMSGMQKNSDGTFTNFASGAYQYTMIPGSIVKGATVYMGLSENVVDPSTIFMDQPIKFKGSDPIGSYRNYNQVDAVKALSVSSNIYMWYTVMRLAGVTYTYDGPLIINDFDGTIKLMRNYYSMFGLGTKTGLDVPNEATGFVGTSTEVSKFLDYAIGQYDTYTPIQIAQYVSTLANGGKKIQPKLVNSATEINSDYTVFDNKTNVLSTLPGSDQALNTVREGFRRCVTDGNCGEGMKKFNGAAKTGTAEAGDTSNASLIGWAPYDQPDVSFVCNAPSSDANGGTLAGNICSLDVMPKALDLFYKKYPENK